MPGERLIANMPPPQPTVTAMPLPTQMHFAARALRFAFGLADRAWPFCHWATLIGVRLQLAPA